MLLAKGIVRLYRMWIINTENLMVNTMEHVYFDYIAGFFYYYIAGQKGLK